MRSQKFFRGASNKLIMISYYKILYIYFFLIDKKKVLQIILGIPLFFKTDEPGAKIYYLCGLDDRYFGILNNFSYKEFLKYPYARGLSTCLP